MLPSAGQRVSLGTRADRGWSRRRAGRSIGPAARLRICQGGPGTGELFGQRLALAPERSETPPVCYRSNARGLVTLSLISARCSEGTRSDRYAYLSVEHSVLGAASCPLIS